MCGQMQLGIIIGKFAEGGDNQRHLAHTLH
jgi:hypothetical protein